MIAQKELLQLLPQALNETNLPLPGKQSGKVRDWYDLPNGLRLIITTDRLSAFDRILARVPYKGQVLNQLSAWWFEQTKINYPESSHLHSRPECRDCQKSESAPGGSHCAWINHRRDINRLVVPLLHR